jgi:hypothetical protein
MPSRRQRTVVAAKAATIVVHVAPVISRGAGQSAAKGSSEGPMVCQPPSPSAAWPRPRPSAGLRSEPLRPAWPELQPDRHAAVLARHRQHTGQRRLVLVIVKAEAFTGDAAARLHRRRLDDQQPGTGKREMPEMDQVPVRGIAILCAELTHRER